MLPRRAYTKSIQSRLRGSHEKRALSIQSPEGPNGSIALSVVQHDEAPERYRVSFGVFLDEIMTIYTSTFRDLIDFALLPCLASPSLQ